MPTSKPFLYLLIGLCGLSPALEAKTHFWDKLTAGKDYLNDEVVVHVNESKQSQTYWKQGKTWKDKVTRGGQTPEAQQVLALASQLGCRLVKKLGTLPFYEFKIINPSPPYSQLHGAALVTAICEAFEAHGNPVTEAEPNGILKKMSYTPSPFPNDPYYQDGNTLWNLNITHLDQTWNTTSGGMSSWSQGIPSILIAIVDTGLNTTHQDFIGRFVTGYNVLDGSTNITDEVGHGTAVASVASVDTNNDVGIAGGGINCEILPVKVANDENGNESDEATGVDWAANNGASIINMSFGGTTNWTPLEDACIVANLLGEVSVAAAGNSGDGAVYYPASYSTVISVAATDSNDQWKTYSTYNSYTALAAPSGIEVCGIGSNSAYGPEDGTSMSSPGVAGLAAILLSNGVANYECVSRMARTADKVDAATHAYATTAGYPLGTWNQYLGYGRINFYRAMCTLVPPTLVSAVISSNQVTLTYNAPALSDAGIIGYNIYRSSTSGGPYTQINVSLVTTLTYTDTTASEGQTYYYVVKGVDANPEAFLTRYSNELSAAIPAASPTNTPTFTISPTFTCTPTATPTFTASPTFTVTSTFSASPTVTPTWTPSYTWTPSPVIPGRMNSVVVYPNPSSGNIWFAFPPNGQTVQAEIYNLIGQRVAALGASYQEAQEGLLPWNGGSGRLATGIYVVVLDEDGRRYLGKFAIIESGFGGGGGFPGFLASPPER